LFVVAESGAEVARGDRQALNDRRAIPLPSTWTKDAKSMTTQGDEWHVMNPRIEEAIEIPYDRSKMGPGEFTIEVTFDSAQIHRLYKGIPRGPIGITRFIKEAALAEADRRAAAADPQELLEAD
jgi:hypothetical protein